MTDRHAELEIARQAAMEGVAAILNVRREAIVDESGRDVKHMADTASESAIIAALTKRSPYPVLAEETSRPVDKIDQAPVWIVDPLDGTVNFSRNIPLGCVSVGLWEKGRPVLGVVHDFYHREVFSGIAGTGAWCNDKPVCASRRSHPSQSILATGFPVRRDFSDPALGRFLDQVRRFKKVRLLGSAALSLAYLASGRIDAYCEETIMIWDVAAGLALLAGAGVPYRCGDDASRPWAKNVWAGRPMIDIDGGDDDPL